QLSQCCPTPARAGGPRRALRLSGWSPTHCAAPAGLSRRARINFSCLAARKPGDPRPIRDRRHSEYLALTGSAASNAALEQRNRTAMLNLEAKSVAAASLAAIAIVGFAGCSSTKHGAQSTTSATPATSMSSSSTTSATADPAADLVGSGCSAYAAQNPSGPGSVAGMAQDPVATAASNNPMLTTLTSALSGKLNPNVNLVDTLNNGQYTVFAP